MTTATIPRTRPCAGRTTCWRKGSGPGTNGPLIIAVEGDAVADQAQLQGFVQTIQETENVNIVVPTPINDQLALLIVYPDSAPQDAETGVLVTTLRDDVIPATGVEANVGGLTAASTDFSNYLAGRMPLLIGVVLLLSFLLLMAVFRSVLVPLKAVVMNLLSIGAAYGILVAIFQWGWGMELIGVDRAGPIEAWVPMFLFAIVFGLSMDYEVFLLSRIKEEYDRTKDNATAVADGLAVTARVITAAALIMFCVFAAFALGDDRQLKLFGLGLAIAVLLDATIVRMLLVPATMELLGDRNWWIPKWLDRILPNIDVEGHAHHEPVAVGATASAMEWSPPRTATVSATTSPSSSRSTELSAPDEAIRRSGADRTGGVYPGEIGQGRLLGGRIRRDEHHSTVDEEDPLLIAGEIEPPALVAVVPVALDGLAYALVIGDLHHEAVPAEADPAPARGLGHRVAGRRVDDADRTAIRTGRDHRLHDGVRVLADIGDLVHLHGPRSPHLGDPVAGQRIPDDLLVGHHQQHRFRAVGDVELFGPVDGDLQRRQLIAGRAVQTDHGVTSETHHAITERRCRHHVADGDRATDAFEGLQVEDLDEVVADRCRMRPADTRQLRRDSVQTLAGSRVEPLDRDVGDTAGEPVDAALEGNEGRPVEPVLTPHAFARFEVVRRDRTIAGALLDEHDRRPVDLLELGDAVRRSGVHAPSFRVPSRRTGRRDRW